MADVDKGGNSGSTESSSAGGAGIPDVFQKFVDPKTGSVDISKAAEAYKQAEQKVTMTTQEKLDLQRSYEELAGRTGSREPAARTGEGSGTGRGLTVDELLTDPSSALDKVVDAKLATAARPILDRLLEKEHPEIGRKADGTFKNPEFVDGLGKFAATLPYSVQQSLKAGDYNTAMWAIEQYKTAVKGAATMATQSTEKGTPFSESGKAPTQTGGGPTFKRSEIRRMVRENPKEYASRVGEIEKAYEEGRVILD